MQPVKDINQYLAQHKLPHMWCPGCGNGLILKQLLTGLAELQIAREKAVLVSGIGCSGRAGDYVNFHRFQGTHGRAIAFATGIHLANPRLTVVCLMGDGDCGAIGLSHLIHAARRNINITAIVANNLNYGMTGGQYSPSTPDASVTSTSRPGKVGDALDLCSLTASAGAGYVARSTVYHIFEAQKMIREALKTGGFGLVEILTPCPTYFGRYNKLGSAVDMMEWLKKKTVPLDRFRQMNERQQQEHFWRGVLAKHDKPDFLSRYRDRGINQ
ncbi:thiamine pyrophosphate-dependent enzyme [Desulfallas thermosapovorans]|uniref:2-oxoglutarate ferredoxin oxidoreductase subunit beta n=1 Tax=Desulfallas thermosapovorans DSM 6562 TaxID=1121431 RepID=A0A5S4ZUU0_9FIRM|nr:thiamine pyrophosphate-dependent enzyme [Desulfallas thermosapovorans]TYO96471.1 2-oxoglutarate ferredoxin oxidoreductase subunit beta [Desulfallas thermosapovorans DSM 6562]